MTNEQINIEVVKAQQGDRKAYETILAHFSSRVYKLSNDNWYKFPNEIHFEQSCFKAIDDAIKRFDPQLGNFTTQIEWRFRQALARTIKRKITPYNLELHNQHDDDEQAEHQFIDDLAVVDDELLANEINEKIALLAEDDSRKLAILNFWQTGFNNDKAIGTFLAKRHDKNPESMRKFVQRFRITCQKALA